MLRFLSNYRNLILPAVAIGASLGLSGCDALMNKVGGDTETPAETVIAEPVVPKVESLYWEWTTPERLNWTKSHVQNTLQFPDGGGIKVVGPDAPTRSDMYLKSPLLEINGSDYPMIKVDISCVANCGVPEIDPFPRIYYITDSHDATVQFSANPLDTSMLAEGERKVLSFDMTALHRGGQDWLNSKINYIRIELPEVNNSDFIIHSVKLCSKDEGC